MGKKTFTDSNALNKIKVLDNSLNELSNDFSQDSFQENSFLEIAPLNLEIDNAPQKDLSSVSINEVELPKVVYMIVGKQVELETKLLNLEEHFQ